MLVVSAVTFPAALLFRRIIKRPGGRSSALLMGLPLALPLVAAVFFREGLFPRVGFLRPVAPALRDSAAPSRFLLLSDGRARLVVPYSLTDSPGPWVVLLLVSVGAVMLARRMVGHIRMRRLMLRCARPTSADGALLACVSSLSGAAGLRTPPEVVFLPEGSTGVFTWGHRRPTILLSRDVVDYLDPDELKGVLAHEIAHIEARDPLVRLLAGLLRDVVVWNPIAHATYRRLIADRELEADKRAALLTGNPLAIASSIVKFCELVQCRSSMSDRGALAFAHARGRLWVRVKSLLALADEGVSLPSAPVPFIVAAALVAVLGLQAGARIAEQRQAAFAIVWGAPSTETTRVWRSNRDLPKFSGGRLAQSDGDATRRVERRDRRASRARRAARLPGFASGLAVRERDWSRWVESMTQWARREGLRTRALTAEATQSWLAVPVLPEPSVGSFRLYRIEPSSLDSASSR
jgi:Zn-dependent protease with chaperone function